MAACQALGEMACYFPLALPAGDENDEELEEGVCLVVVLQSMSFVYAVQLFIHFSLLL